MKWSVPALYTYRLRVLVLCSCLPLPPTFQNVQDVPLPVDPRLSLWHYLQLRGSRLDCAKARRVMFGTITVGRERGEHEYMKRRIWPGATLSSY